MIRTLLALDGALVRGALAFVLSSQGDIDVIAQLDRDERLAPAIRSARPDVAIVDLAVFGTDGATLSAVGPPELLPVADPPCPMLVLTDHRRVRDLGDALRGRSRRLGFLGNDVSPERVVDGVRRLSRGEPVVDADLVAAALTRESPLTARESEILEIAAQGSPIAEIADRLALSPGTIRNHLGRINGKAGARTRIEAIRIARDAGWI